MRNRFAALMGVPLFLAAAPAVDPAVVGTWERRVASPFGQSKLVLEIRPNGTYRSHSEGNGGGPEDTGTANFASGMFSQKSSKTGFFASEDRGTYRLAGPNRLEQIGVLGSTAWQRAGTTPDPAPQIASVPPAPPPVPAIRRVQIGSLRVPSNIGELQAYAEYAAKQWRKDAVPVEIRTRPGASDANALDLDFEFYSPADGARATVAAGVAAGKAVTELGPNTQIPAGRLPVNHSELVTAMQTAPSSGPVQAKLAVFLLRDSYRVLAWEIAVNGAVPLYVEAFSNAPLDGVPGDSFQRGNGITTGPGLKPDWRSAAADFEAYVAANVPRMPPLEGFIGFGARCVQPLACRAASARDADAHARIDGGIPSEADLAKYGPK